MIWDHRCIKGTDESSLAMDSSVPLMNHVNEFGSVDRLGKLPLKEQQQLSRTQRFIHSSHAAMFVLQAQYGPWGIPLTPMIRWHNYLLSTDHWSWSRLPQRKAPRVSSWQISGIVNRKITQKQQSSMYREVHDGISWLYTRFQCYVHRRHLRSSFDMPSFDRLCNLAHIKMLTQRTLLPSNSTFGPKRWIYLTSN